MPRTVIIPSMYESVEYVWDICDTSKHHVGLWEVITGTIRCFLTVYRQSAN